MRPISGRAARHAFDDVGWYRVSGTSKLSSELISLVSRKPIARQAMQPDEQIVRTLPGDKVVVSERHAAARANRLPSW
jgi:hypothetical protein